MIWMNGRLCADDAAMVSVFDRGFLYGDGLFETLPIYAGTPFLLEAHLQRLVNGARALRFANAPDADDWHEAVSVLLAAERPHTATLRLWLSRGRGNGGLGCASATHPTWIAACLPAREYAARIHGEGLVLAEAQGLHALPSHAPTAWKHANYIASILAIDDALARGADEAIVFTPEGNVSEAACSNLFFVIDGTLVTPPLDDGPLAGIVRAQVLAIARSQGIACIEARVPRAALSRASEAFVTGSLIGIAPVARLLLSGDDTLALAAPGPIFRILSGHYATLVESHTGAAWPMPDRTFPPISTVQPRVRHADH